MNGIPTDQIGTEHIQTLVDSHVKERVDLDFKSAFPPQWNDKETKEFLADVSSFANAQGGLLVYGIEERIGEDGGKTGEAGKAVGVAVSNIEAEKLALLERIRNGIAPRIPGILIHDIPGFEYGPVVVIRIPKSYSSPHLITFKDWSRFYSRNSTQKVLLSVDEIRYAFSASESFAERSRAFRDGRIARIVSGDVPFKIADKDQLILHLIPVGAWSARSLDLTRLLKTTMPQPPEAQSWDTRMNLDGVIVSEKPGEEGSVESYYQVFRSGCLEALLANAIQRKGHNSIGGLALTRRIVAWTLEYLKLLCQTGLDEPVAVFLALRGYKDCWLTLESALLVLHPTRFDRDLLLFPEILIESPRTASAEQLQGLLDILWQAASHPRCPFEFKDGEIRQRQL